MTGRFSKEDEKDKEETPGMDMAEAEVRAFVDMEGTTSAWHMANNNRKKIKETQKAVAGLAVLVMGIFLIVLALVVEWIWRII
jgi:hypothetical protein